MQRPRRKRPPRGTYTEEVLEEEDFAVLTDDSCGEESSSEDDEFDSDEDYVVVNRYDKVNNCLRLYLLLLL